MDFGLVVRRTWPALCLLAFSALGGEEAKEAPKRNEWHGVLGCAKCMFAAETKAESHAAALKVGNEVYYLKAGDQVPGAVKDYLARVEQDRLKGEYLVRGEESESEGRKWITVTSLVAKPLPQSPATVAATKRSSGSSSSSSSSGGASGGGQAEEDPDNPDVPPKARHGRKYGRKGGDEGG
jgi:uncharacterized membrane protein YgcG